MATANDVLALAKSQIGYKESPSGSNKTKYGKEYGLNGQPWCAIFVWWVCKHAGDVTLFCGGKKDAYCPTIADYYIAHKQTVSKSSGMPGDIVLFGFGHKNSQHIGFIEKKNADGSYTCIEGNTSTGNNCNGGMVMRRTRHTQQINWIVRPKYKNARPTEAYTGNLPYLPKAVERKAVECAYKYGTPLKTVKYKGGTIKEQYREALNRAYPSRGSWGKQARAGASCDVFVGTCVRSAGENDNFPRGLKEQTPYLKKHFTKCSKEHGAIGWKSNHVVIYVSIKGKMYVANAHHNKNKGMYGVIEANRKMTKYYRTTKTTMLQKGDTFTSVKYMQEFLKWYGEDVGPIDSDFGNKTDTALRNFQYKEGLTVDGKCGAKTIAKMKEVSKL